MDLDELLGQQHGVATSGQLLAILSRRALASMLRAGELAAVWPGIYGRGDIDDDLRLRGLDLRADAIVIPHHGSTTSSTATTAPSRPTSR